MGPCCSLTYEKYLTEGKGLDKEALAEVLAKRGETRSVEEFLADPKTRLCQCRCHVIGTKVLH